MFNLSFRKLTDNEICLLSKGFKFTPTPTKSNYYELESDTAEFHRKLKVKDSFHDKNSVEDNSLVRNKSDFYPQKGRNVALNTFVKFTKIIPVNKHIV